MLRGCWTYFAPVNESTLWQRVIDVAFCSTILPRVQITEGGRIGFISSQLPGVNSAYRRSVLQEVGGFDQVQSEQRVLCSTTELEWLVINCGR